MYTLSNLPIPEVVTPPSTLPITTSEAKRHLNLSESDDAHDQVLEQYIAAATQQFETDCNRALITRTMRVRLPEFAEFRFAVGPVVSITSVVYRDRDNATQTLAATEYALDTSRDMFRIVSDALPETFDRWDAVTINYTIGRSTADPLAKSAILLLVAHYFENRDMLIGSSMADMIAYERICRLLHRGGYP